jgi:hypothetical protein
VFRNKSEKVVSRDEIVKAMRKGARKLKIPENAVSVISLWAGVASAMWDAKFSTDEIKRRGRWASNAFNAYVWEGRNRARNVTASMLGSKFSLMASLAYYNRHRMD